MAELFASNSGYVRLYTTNTWANVRGATTGNAVSDTSNSSTQGVRAYHTSGRGLGTDTYWVARSFFYFDTSGITEDVSHANLRIYGLTNNTADTIVVKSTAFGGDGSASLVNDDFNNFATGSGNDYSSEKTIWGSTGYNGFDLNLTAKNNMKNNDHLIVCVMEYDHDYQNVAPVSEDLKNGMYYDPQSGTSFDPKIYYELGYQHKVLSTEVGPITFGGPATSGEVSGVAYANIGKVNGV